MRFDRIGVAIANDGIDLVILKTPKAFYHGYMKCNKSQEEKEEVVITTKTLPAVSSSSEGWRNTIYTVGLIDCPGRESILLSHLVHNCSLLPYQSPACAPLTDFGLDH